MKDDNGQAWQAKLWQEVSEKLESIEPGCIEAMMRR
jgi:hypothetical protein